ncbi:DNA helicase RecQ [Xylanibacillus composti]|uniref:DNA helicase RecQ n=1 Tax=Xylanibacillus composti TaxID=1572762 RepID=A0A8J4M3P8_9BACL|nr:DNA helicase RecQ [Xylanibacillus composti]MDT9724009.1 DNA helicase RecQ [Xylanibacillus composti]GIQ71085.1 ATP-dependent DNA helicase RecQ [Xylanibacillus composti]
MIEQARQALKQWFGYDAFRKGQEELVSALLDGRDALAVMPTGAGKSICYQLPALMLPGTTLVVSPLISLMKDQVDALNETGIATAFLNSTLRADELNRTMQEMEEGRYKMIYIAPERLDSERFMRLVSSLHIPLIAVDEAHCVSQWGHDFRPSYMQIPKLLRQIHPRPVVAAFTATATDKVKEDIVQHLKLSRPVRVTTGYARENLTFSVVKGVDKRKFLASYMQQRAGQSGIIYASTRKEVDSCRDYLLRLGIEAGRYHAGLSEQERAESQEKFLYDELKVMVATNAFGMGIDKSNVRFVLHYNVPKNLESYYQEAGRAGRDGEPGECVLLYAPQDTMTQKFLIEQGESDEQRKQMEYANLRDMIDYCHTTGCLQKHVVTYFGEQDAAECGRCSSCTDEREVTDITEHAQKIFSCVVRMKQRFGITITAKVLRGAKDAKVRQFGFDRLPTYGVMGSYKEKEIVQLINVLAADGYLRLSDSQFPVLSLTQRAVAVLEGKERVEQRVTIVEQAAERIMLAGDDELFDRLRQLRKSLADKAKVPPFTIFHDATLREMCVRLPASEAELGEVKGVGERKLARYGRAFLQVIAEYAAETKN